MSARTSYGLDTPRGFHWDERAACSPINGDVDPDWWWPPERKFDADAKVALHVCRFHCPVRVQCFKDALADPPQHACVRGGHHWVIADGNRRATPSKVVKPATSNGNCPYCTGEES